MMNILALDLGDRRVGLAYGNTDGGIAFAMDEILLRTEGDLTGLLRAIEKIVQQKNIQKIVVGHPGSLAHDQSVQAQKCSAFADQLEDFLLSCQMEVLVELVDEAFSSRTAEHQLSSLGIRGRSQRHQKDSLAAASFLQTYLDMNCV